MHAQKNVLNRTKFKIIWLKFATAFVFPLALIACGSGGANQEVTSPPVIEKPAPLITQFSFLRSNNPQLSSDIHLSIANSLISGRVPKTVDISELVASVEHNASQLILNGEIQTNSISTSSFDTIVTYTIKMDDGREASYQVDVTKFTGLPIVSLDTDGNAPIDSKEEYVYGQFAIDGGRHFDDFATANMRIRGRGNSTWFTHPKKPYQMKLEDSAEVLGMPKKKTWLFLAEYSDKTMLRNTLAFELGEMSSLDWTPRSEFAEVFINEQYNGTYNITEKVEEGSNRVDLTGGGFLLEIDQLDRQDVDDVYFYTDKFLVAIKEPELSWDDSQYQYIKSQINEFETALFGSQFTNPSTGYAKYIDIDSFVDWYLISEITKNVDSQFFSSIYFHMVPGQKIKMGPLWDFDLAFGNVDYADPQYADGFWVKYNPWFVRLFSDPAFVAKVKTRFNYFRENQSAILAKIDSEAEKLKWAQQENDAKWQTLGVYVWPNPVVYDTYAEEVSHLKTWFTRRMNWLDTAIGNL